MFIYFQVLALKVSVSMLPLSFSIVRERKRTPESLSDGSVCHLRRRRQLYAVKRIRRSHFSFDSQLSGLVQIYGRLAD